MSEAASWYYVGTYGQLGPLTTEQFDEFIEAGVIERTTYVWRPGMPDWVPASVVPELLTLFDKYVQSPVPPILSQPSVEGFANPVVNQPPVYGQPPLSANPMYVGQSFSRSMTKYSSDKDRTTAGLLSIIIPGGGRFYLGYAALGTIQLMLTFITCGFLHVWSIIDGVLMLSGQVKIDGYGRKLED